MKKVLIYHDNLAHQIYPFINYLLGFHAMVYTKVDAQIKYDCILIDENLILSDEIEYIKLMKEEICHPGTIVISMYMDDIFGEPEVLEYADLRMPLDSLRTLYDRDIEDIFGRMWYLPIEWPLRYRRKRNQKKK